ncbi:hypothetical protein VNI00_008170 [Paramarasmius palmivorus]|uniref:Glycosyltransferase 2-like domain-containing protein n=1 Tax=Paramarasmius palmivorus TaxID=297713 RepID=A0AAW0CXJ3_9AGAR
MDYDRWDALLHHIFKQTQGDAWFRPQEENLTSGVAVRVGDSPPEFRVFPYENISLEPFEAAVKGLNPVPAVAVKIRSAAVHAALGDLKEGADSLYVDTNTRIQVLDTMLSLPHADAEQCAAFIRDERVLVVWSSSLDAIIPTCQDFDERLIKLLWRSRPAAANTSSSFISSAPNSIAGHAGDAGSVSGHSLVSSIRRHSQLLPVSVTADPEKALVADPSTVTPQFKTKRTWYGKKVQVPVNVTPPRRTVLYAPVYNGLAAAMAAVFIGNGVKILLWEWYLDNMFTRFALLVTLPFLYCVSLFFALQIIQNVTMAIGPIAHYHENSTYFSSVVPPPNPQVDARLPHITIQMPVYKEGLESVLMPSVESLKAAMKTYARQGGTSSIFICDDGLRLLPMADRDARIRWYREMGVGWVARPRHGCPAEGSSAEDGDPEKGAVGRKDKRGRVETFHRAGRFKKASNMNYGLKLSLCMEKCLETLVHEKETGSVHFSRQSHGQATPTLAQLASREQHELEESLSSSNSHHRYPPTSPNLGSPKSRSFGYGMQYLGRDGDDMTVSATASMTDPLTNPLAFGTPTPGTPVVPGTPITGGAGIPLLPTSGVDEQGVLSSLDTLASEDLGEKALQMAIEEVYETSGRKWKPWAAGAKAMRMGEIVLLVDSDTVVPEDCLRDAAREMGQDQNVAIIQHESDVMQVAHHYFENGIAYFTRRINKCISMACANGEIAPFVGHNAFLRWRALQDVAYTDGNIWSECNVSEDFDMALRLMKKGWVVRWATYSKGGFKEGVSLTVDDELNRWMKYAYGCNEYESTLLMSSLFKISHLYHRLLFNPVVEWWRKGPIAPQIHRFMWSNAPLHYKISMMAYMFSYYGIAAALPIALLNYTLLGFQLPVDGFYLHSWEIWLATTVVFFGSGNVGYTILGYRLGERELIKGALENLMWIPFFFFFFGGLSIPVSQSILAHVFSYNITWSATIKEVERSNFFKEIPKIAKRFWFSLLTCIIIVAGMIICATPLVPIGFRIDSTGWAVIFPLSVVCACHILFPIVLNPWLMVFSY